jgi:hypothetical protein
MIEGLDQAGADKRTRHDFGREQASERLALRRRKIENIGDVDDDLAVPLLELFRDILVSWKRDGKKDHLGVTGVLKGLGNDASTELSGQRRKRLRSTRVGDGDFDVIACEDARERGADLAGTNDGVFHRGTPLR